MFWRCVKIFEKIRWLQGLKFHLVKQWGKMFTYMSGKAQIERHFVARVEISWVQELQFHGLR